MKSPLHLVVSDDGSHTVFVPALGEHYHSRYGAITESLHVFIRAGFNSLRDRNRISVLEVGFGTGLNAWLTCAEAVRERIQVDYLAVEKYPLELEFVRNLNYPESLSCHEMADDTFLSMHLAPWGQPVQLTPFFTLHKLKEDFTVFQPQSAFNLVYYDAFAPAKQPALWQVEQFRKIREKMEPAGVLVTYCVKGQVKRALKEAGFRTEILPGPPGKRHMLRAVKA